MDPISFHYSDDNRKNTFNNGGKNGHDLKIVTCKQTFIQSLTCPDKNQLVNLMFTTRQIFKVNNKWENGSLFLKFQLVQLGK